MKTIFRLSMIAAVLTLLAWTGVAVPADEPLPNSCEYAFALDTGNFPSSPMVPITRGAAVAPEVGTWEHSLAMETGNLPSLCGDEPCGKAEYSIVEYGGLPFRVGLDDNP